MRRGTCWDDGEEGWRGDEEMGDGVTEVEMLVEKGKRRRRRKEKQKGDQESKGTKRGRKYHMIVKNHMNPQLTHE